MINSGLFYSKSSTRGRGDDIKSVEIFMIKTTQLSKTIREYMEMIDGGQLELDPEYQREFLHSNDTPTHDFVGRGF